MAFEDEHNKYEALKRCKPEDGTYLRLRTQGHIIQVSRRNSALYRSPGTLPWRNKPDRILNDGAPNPGARPLLEYPVSFCGFSDASDKALLRPVSVSGQEKRKQVESAHVLDENPLEVCSRRVSAGACDLFGSCARHTHPLFVQEFHNTEESGCPAAIS